MVAAEEGVMEPIYLLGACAVLIVMYFGIWALLVVSSEGDKKWAARLDDAAPKFDDDLGMMEVDE